MQKPFDLVMFDLDGTLVETAPEISDAVNDTLVPMGVPAVTQQQVNDWIGHGTRNLLIQALAAGCGSNAASVVARADFAATEAEFGRHYQARCGTRSHLYPHVREVLVQLRAQGVHLAVVTNKEGRYTRTVLDVHRLTALFDAVISGDTLPTKKPDPAGVRHCLQRFATPATRALFVGDSSIDVATARNAGVPVWAVPYGYNMGQAIAASQPDRLIENFRALLPAQSALAQVP